MCHSHREFAGVKDLQHQFVWYAAHNTEHATAAPDGWTLAESDPSKLSAGQAADANVPHEVSLAIVTAPAEFGVPMKQDRQFTPSFKVQVPFLPLCSVYARNHPLEPWLKSLKRVVSGKWWTKHST